MNFLQLFSPAAKSDSRSELSAALASCRSAFIATALFSGMSNILMLTGAIFMLEIYDRVLPSHSVPTLDGAHHHRDRACTPRSAYSI